MLYGINQRMRVEDVDSPLLDVRPVKTILLVGVTGDRGLCGGYNNQVIKKVLPGTHSSILGNAAPPMVGKPISLASTAADRLEHADRAAGA